MKVKELNSKKMYKEYSIEIPYKEISDSIDNKIKEMLPSVEMPGFRKGKAPLNIVKKKYENNILAEVLESIAKDNTKKLLEEKQLRWSVVTTSCRRLSQVRRSRMKSGNCHEMPTGIRQLLILRIGLFGPGPAR